MKVYRIFLFQQFFPTDMIDLDSYDELQGLTTNLSSVQVSLTNSPNSICVIMSWNRSISRCFQLIRSSAVGSSVALSRHRPTRSAVTDLAFLFSGWQRLATVGARPRPPLLLLHSDYYTHALAYWLGTSDARSIKYRSQ